jgi:hypothetical protein
MPSVMAWLDQSAEQQRRVRELVKLFSETESRDELGIGQIRDVFSNQLFPGTSVIQTRARYFLFVPWLFQMHERRKRSGDDLLRRVQESERQLIDALQTSGESRGLIGIRAGAGVKILPSAIYWGGLTRFGILTRPVAPNELGLRPALAQLDPGAAEERVTRWQSSWHRTMPDPPPGFPAVVDGGFALTGAEAQWLKEAILETASNTLLAHLVNGAEAPAEGTFGPWDDPAVLTADADILALCESARRFSLVMHGASLLYNLILAQTYVARGFDAIPNQTDLYVQELSAWGERVDADMAALESWDLRQWFTEVLALNPRISVLTQRFVTDWISLVRSGSAGKIAASAEARDLIANREQVQKKAQSRIRNERLLRTWTGASGSEPLVYRWGTVRDLVTDIVDATEEIDAVA